MADTPLEELSRDERYARFQEGMRAGTIERRPSLGCLGTLAALTVPGYMFHLRNKDRKEAIKHGYDSVEGGVSSFVDALLAEATKGVVYWLALQAVYQAATGNPLIQ